MRILGWLSCAVVVVGCGGGDDAEPASACEQAMSAAAAIGDTADTVGDIDPAIAACVTLAEFTAASDKYPAALDGADPATFVANRCADTATGALCDAGSP